MVELEDDLFTNLLILLNNETTIAQQWYYMKLELNVLEFFDIKYGVKCDFSNNLTSSFIYFSFNFEYFMFHYQPCMHF